jgi:hypothetical protein
MNTVNIQTIANLVFLVVIAMLTLSSLLTIYIFVKYGRSRSITVSISMIYGAIFILQTITAFAILQKLS